MRNAETAPADSTRQSVVPVAQGCAGAPAVAQFASPDASLALSRQCLVAAVEVFPFLGPLLEAITLGATGPAVFVTLWGGNPSGHDIDPDPAKHALYVERVREIVRNSCPWLAGLLDAAGATVLVEPGTFVFFVAHRPGYLFPIPSLAALNHLRPWAELAH